MKICTFRASSIHEALQLVRERLGTEATVLHIRELKTKRRFGRSSEKYFEIDASNDVQIASRFSDKTSLIYPEKAPSRQSDSKPALGSVVNSNSPPAVSAKTTFDESVSGDTAVADTVHGPKKNQPQAKLESLAEPGPPADVGTAMADTNRHNSDTRGKDDKGFERNKPSQVADSHPWYETLLANGFNPRTASELIVQAESSSNCATPNRAVDLDTEQLISCVADTLNTTEGLLGNSVPPHSIAFAGPPGAGKTSVLVKLASLAVRQMDLSVGLVTFDCFRQGGVDQLLYFAEQLETPLEVVDDAARVSATMSRLQEYDLVLIDTPGFPARADASLASLQALLEAAEPEALCLVLDACRSPGCVAECFRGYQCLKPSHVIVSKVDEAVRFGSLYSPLKSSLLPISYLTNGQDVSSDIQEATPNMLARLMLGSDALKPPLNKNKKQAA